VADIRIERRDDHGLATVMARKGVGTDAIGSALGLLAPARPGRHAGDDGLSLIGIGAGTWLALREAADPFWSDGLRDRLAGLASVSDQSGAYVIFRITGAGARTLLQRGLAIDLHPAVFGPGAAAVSAIAHIGVVIWPVTEGGGYDVAIQRSYANCFAHWLDEGVAAL